MAQESHIRNPIEWGWDALKETGRAVEKLALSPVGTPTTYSAQPTVVRVRASELKDVLAQGLQDFGACRTDVIFLGIVYPVVGLVLARLAAGYDLLPLIFPLASGFVLIGPVAAVGLYEMSRLRDQGKAVSWADGFGAVRSPAFGAIFVLAIILLAIFLLWLFAADEIYRVTLGPQPPASVRSFVHDIFATRAGWTLIVVGIGVGFLFACLVLTISVVSFPLLLDKNVGVATAVSTSVRVVLTNPGPMALWGIIVAGSLAVGSIPLLLGLIVVVPVLGHSTWHLYRKVVSFGGKQ